MLDSSRRLFDSQVTAPATTVNSGASGTQVIAPGTMVNSTAGNTAVTAPGTAVTSNGSGTKVNAPGTAVLVAPDGRYTWSVTLLAYHFQERSPLGTLNRLQCISIARKCRVTSLGIWPLTYFGAHCDTPNSVKGLWRGCLDLTGILKLDCLVCAAIQRQKKERGQI